MQSSVRHNLSILATALADVRSAIRFDLDTFGPDAIAPDDSVLEALVAETQVA